MSLPSLPSVQRLSSRVICILGQNARPYTLQGTNTYLVGTGARRVLIDVGEGVPAYGELLARVLEEEEAEIGAVLLTHHHPDHVGGLRDPRIKDLLGDDVKVLKYPGGSLEGDEEGGGGGGGEDESGKLFVTVEDLKDGEVVSEEGATLQAIYTPGHCDDHTSFVLHEERSIFVGDCVLGLGSSVFSDLFEYEASLKKLHSFQPARIYCGHGPCIGPEVEAGAGWWDGGDEEVAGEEWGGVRRIKEYLEHRKARENQVVEALHSLPHHTPVSADALAEKIYAPEGISGDLMRGAANNVLHTLRKLAKEGKVTLQEEDEDVPIMKTNASHKWTWEEKM